MKKKIQFTIKEYNLSTKQKREITMDESQFIHILCELAGTKLTEGFPLPWLVKVVGITQDNYNDVVIDGIDYEFYIATTSQMKKNEGYYIAKIHEGINPVTRYKYRRYTMIRLKRRRE